MPEILSVEIFIIIFEDLLTQANNPNVTAYGFVFHILLPFQAGYSPLMLAALVGFERKNDKYIMQRLLRMGDINKESSEVGLLH